MKKKIIFIAVYFLLAGILVIAQDKENITPPPPPPPPAAETLMVPPPAPAFPPTPPPPPEPVDPVSNTALVIYNNGYEVRIKKIKGTMMIMPDKDETSKQTKLSTWNADKKLCEKKSGQLPPRLPAPPAEFLFR